MQFTVKKLFAMACQDSGLIHYNPIDARHLA